MSKKTDLEPAPQKPVPQKMQQAEKEGKLLESMKNYSDRKEREAQIKKAIAERLKQRDERIIKQLTLMELYDVYDRFKAAPDPMAPGSDYHQIKMLHDAMGLTSEDMDFINDRIKTYRRNIIEYVKDEKKYPVWSHVKRGKLGFDAAFMFFGVFGMFLLVPYFHFHFKDIRENIVKSRPISPEQIRLLDENSFIDLSEVTIPVINNFNYELDRQEKQDRRLYDQRMKLEKQIYG